MGNPYRIVRASHSPPEDELALSYDEPAPRMMRELGFDPDTIRGLRPGRVIPQEELRQQDVIDYAPEASDIINQMPGPWQQLANTTIANIEEPTDYAIVSAARDVHNDYLASTFHEMGVPQAPPQAPPSARTPAAPAPRPPQAPYITIIPQAPPTTAAEELQRANELVGRGPGYFPSPQYLRAQSIIAADAVKRAAEEFVPMIRRIGPGVLRGIEYTTPLIPRMYNPWFQGRR